MDKFRVKFHWALFDPEKGPEGEEETKKQPVVEVEPYIPQGNKLRDEEKYQHDDEAYMELLEDGTIDKVVTFNGEWNLQLELWNIEASKRAEVAEVILKWNWKMEKVFLHWLLEMSDWIVSAMKDKGIREVYLGDCKKIQPGQIEQMWNLWVKNLELYGLDSLDYEQAKALWNFERVRLSSLITQEHLKPEILKELCNVKKLSLEWVTGLSPEQAKCFENCNVEELVLWLSDITEDQARCLSNIRVLDLRKVTELGSKQTEIFSSWKVEKVVINGYEEILFNENQEDNEDNEDNEDDWLGDILDS